MASNNKTVFLKKYTARTKEKVGHKNLLAKNQNKIINGKRSIVGAIGCGLKKIMI